MTEKIPSPLEMAEESMIRNRELFSFILQEERALREQFDAFMQTHTFLDENAQQLYKTLREELDNLEQYGTSVATLEQIDTAECRTLLEYAIRAHEAYEDMLHRAQRDLHGDAQHQVLAQLAEVQATLATLKEKWLAYGFDTE